MSNEHFMDNTTYGQLGLKKLNDIHPDFHWFCAERLGEGKGAALKLDGCQFRAATRGPRKGQMVIPVKGTKRTVIVTYDEIDAYKAANKGEGGGV